MNNSKKLTSFLILMFIFNFYPVFSTKKIITKNAKASEITSNIFIQPDYKLFLDKDYLYIELTVDTGEKAINAIETTLNFETDKLSLDQISYDNSFCDLFIEEKIDNLIGNLKIACGSPNANYGTGTIAKLKFNKIKEGWTKMNVGESTVLENNGLGTPLTSNNEIHRIYIVK